MAVLYKDLVRGNEATLTVDGWTINRTAIVDKIGNYFGYAKIFAATAFLKQEGVYVGVQHPECPTATLRQINPVSISTDAIEFNLVYRENSPIRVTGTTSLSQESTNKDSEGNPIVLEYTYPEDYVDPNTGALSSLAGKTVKQGGTVTKLIPETSFNYTRTESAGSSESYGLTLLALQAEYTGKVNKGSWILGPKTYLEYTWLCAGITWDTQDGGKNYDVTYSFSYRPKTINFEDTRNNGWKTTINFVRVDGNPAPDAVTGTSKKHIELYESIEFGPLNIV